MSHGSARACVVLVVALVGCSPPPGQTPDWSFARNAVGVRFNADSSLNLYDRQPHALRVVVYQLSTPDVFNELGKTEQGLQTLLACTTFDASVMGRDRLTVMPGQKDMVYFDRSEKAQWIGIAAGYYGLDPGNVHRLIEIPVIRKRRGPFRWLLDWVGGMLGISSSRKYILVGNLLIDLILGPQIMHATGTLQ